MMERNVRTMTTKRPMWCLPTDQGTAPPETTLCDECFGIPNNQRKVWDNLPNDVSRLTVWWTECTQNDAVRCCVCGWPDMVED